MIHSTTITAYGKKGKYDGTVRVEQEDKAGDITMRVEFDGSDAAYAYLHPLEAIEVAQALLAAAKDALDT